MAQAKSTGENLKSVIDDRFSKLVDKRALSPAFSTREMDGRLIPIVFVTVLDDQRRPVSGLVLELRDGNGNVLDRVSSLRGGFGILQFPARKPLNKRVPSQGSRTGPLADGGDVVGAVFLLEGNNELQKKAIKIPANLQAARVEFIQPFGNLPVQLPPGDDPLAHLPIDFSEDSCNLLLGARNNGLLDPNNLTTRPDPLLSPPVGTATIVGKRLPLIRRFDIIRFAPDGNRFLVRLRQEWVLLTYTLGELAKVTALDPGAVVQSVEQDLKQAISTVRDAARTAKQTLSQTLQDNLSNLGAIDTVVHSVQQTTANAGGSGWYIGIPGLVGYGQADVSAGLTVDLNVDTSVNTSLLVNRAVQQASTLVNEAIDKVNTLTQSTQRTTSDVANNLAPLVTQVANALHWRVYEVYAVCTNVDAVYPIDVVPLFMDPLPPFTRDQVLSFRPFFQPALLDPNLVSAFDDLLQAAELPPLTSATIEVTYNASATIRIGLVTVNLNSFPITITLGGVTASSPTTVTGGTGRTVTAQVTFTTPVVAGDPVPGEVKISTPTFGGFTVTASIAVTRVQVWIDRPLSQPGVIQNNVTTNPSDFFFAIPTAGGPAGAGVLVKHINNNLHYYWGVLAAAAIVFPSLRQDVPQLSGLDPRLFRLPLIGMEGTNALLLDPTQSNIDVTQLLDDPGAGTLVQILAPGSYGEILQGILQLVGQLHPLLTQVGTISPFGSFPTLPVQTLPTP